MAQSAAAGRKKDDDLAGYAWLSTFLPALLYFVATRTVFSTHRGGIGRRYDVAADVVLVAPPDAENDNGGPPTPTSREEEKRKALGEIFHLSKKSPVSASSSSLDGGGDGSSSSSYLALSYPLETVLSGPPSSNPLLSVSSLLWVHDPELGRGYLLLSDSALSGRLWRWEVGGGPITIGRSLHMEWSGCRSGLWGGECPDNKHSEAEAEAETAAGGKREAERRGSAGLAVQFDKDADHPRHGALLVLERGERRLVRIEEDGARTPLALEVPVPVPPGAACAQRSDEREGEGGEREREDSAEPKERRPRMENVRMAGNGRVVYTPFGDAVFSDSPPSDSASISSIADPAPFAGVYRLREAANVPPVPSARSLEAHSWNATVGAEEAELLYTGMESVSGLALTRDATEGVLVGGRLKGVGTAIVRLPLDDDDEEDGDSDDEEEGRRPTAAVSDPSSLGLLDSKVTVVHDLSDLFAATGANTGPAMTIDSDGRLYVSHPGGILILSPTFERLGFVPLREGADGDAAPAITDLEIGDDRYLYACAASSLMRVRIKPRRGTVQTDLVVPGAGRKKRAA